MAKMVIFDSDILIDYFKEIEQAKEFTYSFERERRLVTSISVMEVYIGARNKGELAAFKKFFAESFASIVHIDEEASSYLILQIASTISNRPLAPL